MFRKLGFAVWFTFCVAGGAQAETIQIARQYGLAYLPFLLMEDQKLIEKHAAALGQPDLVVNWVVLSGAAAMNDGLLSGTIAFGSGAPPGLILLWDKTHATANQVLGLGAIATMPTTLNTRNPAVRTVAGLTDTDRIALPSVKISNAALVLEMQAAKLYGPENYTKFDHLTLTLGHPDAALQVMGSGEINSHFASPPFEHLEWRNKAVHPILSSLDVMGDASLTDVWTTRKFADAHPIAVQAMFDAMSEAIAIINANKSAAADEYLRLSHDKISRETLMEVLADPHIIYGTAPLGTMAFAEFMHRTGTIKTIPKTWQEMFLPVAQSLPGN
jgi:NitT/TauT family transport system substrate-binding protein